MEVKEKEDNKINITLKPQKDLSKATETEKFVAEKVIRSLNNWFKNIEKEI